MVVLIEQTLQLPPGTLTSTLSGSRGRQRVGNTRAPYYEIPKDVRLMLPGEAVLWSAERLAAETDELSKVRRGSSEFGRYLKHLRDPRRSFTSFTPTTELQSQLNSFYDFKTSPTTFPLQRVSNGRWKGETKKIWSPLIEQFFRFMATPIGTNDGEGGLGVPIEAATIAWLAVPRLVLGFLAHRASRCRDLQTDGNPRGTTYSQTEVNIVNLVAAMTHPKTGWLSQNPQLSASLSTMDVELRGSQLNLLDPKSSRTAISTTDLAAARSDWGGFCTQAHIAYNQARNFLKDVAVRVRNPFVPIAGLTDADEPMAELLVLLWASEKRWRDKVCNPSGYRSDVRNSVMHRLHAATSFRPGNVVELTYRDDQSGKIRKRNGVWEIEVPFHEFKNYKNCRLFGTDTNRRNFCVTLEDGAGLYDLLDLYFHDVRNEVNPDGIDAAFLTRGGRAMDVAHYNQSLLHWSKQHVVWNRHLRTGLPNVTHLYPYSFRHIRASDILRTSESNNKIEEAAFALQTSEDMIRKHYGDMIPEQALRGSSRTMNASIDRAKQLLMERGSG